MLFYVHGSGRTGDRSWPRQSRAGAVFADHGAARTIRGRAELVRAQAPDGPFALVASSLGGVVAAVAMRDLGLAPACVVLAEPALYDIARGVECVEAYLAPMGRAYALAAEGDLRGYWRVARPFVVGAGEETDEEVDWEQERPLAERTAAIEPPWGQGLTGAVARYAPTLVVTGGWNDEYEAIAEVLVQHGAAATTLPGHGHRVQDHPRFDAVVRDFTRSHLPA